MAGYVFAIGGFEDPLKLIRICVERGVYSTYLKNLLPTSFEGTLADYMSMRPGDNIYFFSKRKYYGIGELVLVGPDCKYNNFPSASALQKIQYNDIQDDLLVDFGEDSPCYRWMCVFKGAPCFFETGIDTDDILTYKPNTFRMLRAFWKVSFIKLSDEENESLKEVFLLRHQEELQHRTGILAENERTHTNILQHDLTRYLISPQDLLCTCSIGDRLKHEMALEAAVVYDLCHEGILSLGSWDYVSHQVVASPFKPIDYMDRIDVFAMRYLPETKIPCKYLVVELKKDDANRATIDQVLKYVDWVCSEYAYGDYETIEASIIAAGYQDDTFEYFSNAVQRYFTLGSHPVRNMRWRALKLIKYTYAENKVIYTDVTPVNA